MTVNTGDPTYYQERRHRLITDTKNAIQEEEESVQKIKETVGPLRITAIVMVIGLIINIAFFTYSENYLMFWIVSSFLLLMFNPFILMIPKDPKSLFVRNKKSESDLSDQFTHIRTDVRTVYGQKKFFGETLWNIFFINCQPLAPGFGLLFGMDIIFAIYGASTGTIETITATIITFQSVAIILFYAGTSYVQPYSEGFFDSMLGIHKDIKAELQAGWRPALKFILLIALIAAASGILLIAALMLPGMTLNKVISIENIHHVGWRFIPLVVVFIFQVMLVRYLQGASSRTLVLRMSRHKTSVLRETVLSGLNALPETENEETREELEELGRLSHRVNACKPDYHELFGFFPVFLLAPDIRRLLET